ncbi:MAG: GNAT family N-acetyltransferase [Lachnospiraceae bacterium]|nr:GNAT family N-acetyltransferase [Lachnospiraceae bacterium]
MEKLTNNEYKTDVSGITLRFVREGEEGTVLQFIRAIAAYEKMSDCVIATEEGLHRAIFEQHACNVLLIEQEGVPVGFCLYFHTFSTFCGRTNLYLEDIFLNEEVRGRGIGREVFRVLMEIALEEGCERLEWVCLNWNAPSIAFYRRMGAFPLSDWTTWRMTAKDMRRSLSGGDS